MIIRFIYYKSFLFFTKQTYRRNIKIKSYGVLVILLTMNIYTLLSIIKALKPSFSITSVTFILIPLLLLGILSLIFTKKISDRIVESFNRHNDRQILFIKISTIIYIIGSIVLFFVFMNNLVQK